MAGIDKRACRAYFDPALTIPRRHGLLLAEPIQYIVRTGVRNIGGSRLLVLYFYEREQAAKGVYIPRLTIFQSRDSYATLFRKEDDSLKWREAHVDNLSGVYGYSLKCKSAFYCQKDQERVTRYCKINGENGFDALSCLQHRILDARRTRRIRARERRVLEKMNTAYKLPQQFKRWVFNEVMPAYIFYRYQRSKTGMPAYCTACGNDLVVTEARHNKTGHCPCCKRRIQYKASGRATNVWDRDTAQIIQKTKTGDLVIRIVKCYIQYRDYRNPDVSLYENSRIFVRCADGGRPQYEDYYYSWNDCLITSWKKGLRPRFSRWQPNFEAEQCCRLYPANLDKVLRDTPWRYSQIKLFSIVDGEPLEVEPYLRQYLLHPFIEYLVKLGLTRLAASVVYKGNEYGLSSNPVNLQGNNLKEILGVEKEDIRLLQEANATPAQLVFYRNAKADGNAVSAGFLRWFGEHRLHEENVRYLLRFVKWRKLMRYADRQYQALGGVRNASGNRRYDGLRQIVSEYGDYLSNCDDLEYDLTDSYILFPRNLMEAHDQSVELMDKKQVERYTAVFRRMYGGLVRQYQFAHEGLMVLPPESPMEVVEEGNTLHHCVSGYVKRVADGKCVILFLRRKEEPAIPFYTMEIRGEDVIQVRGERNGAAPREIMRFVELFKKQKLLPAAAPAAA